MTEPAALQAEWDRIAALIGLAEMARHGQAPDQAFAAALSSATDAVAAGRAAGAWTGLQRLLDAEAYAGLVQIDIDLLAMALAPEACPSLAPRLMALQPYCTTPQVSLPLLQELLLLDSSAEVGLLLDRLDRTGPLQAGRLIQIEGEGALQQIRAAPHAGAALLGRSIDLGPPPGAHLVTRRVRWDDLVLPEPTLRALHEFTAWVRHRDLVFGEWGARRLGGPMALFNGPSGAGKSYSAAAIATELTAQTGDTWSLFALDLGRIMSKYVGETEKNLNRLLDALHGRRAVLQIDEADGLLGKRGEISDARDRYSNLEVSHMLSRFEQHDGPVILTTNLRANIDAAFLRRFQLIVEFPAADREARAALWSRLIPPRAPIDDRVGVEALADAAVLGAGSIHNAAVYAAMLAAEAREPIGYRHLSRAVWRELNKDARHVRPSEIGFLADHLEEAMP